MRIQARLTYGMSPPLFLTFSFPGWFGYLPGIPPTFPRAAVTLKWN